MARIDIVEVIDAHRLDGHTCDCGIGWSATFTDDEVHNVWAAHLARKIEDAID